jgi:hypothetical protein
MKKCILIFAVLTSMVQYTKARDLGRDLACAIRVYLVSLQEHNDYKTIAHRGYWISGAVPENSIQALNQAVKHGYKMVECDVKKTSDGKIVIMHDATINRTMRNTHDYSPITQPIDVANSTFQYLLENFVFASDNELYRTPIPALEEFLQVCKANGIFPLLHGNITEAFELAQSILGDHWCCFSSSLQVCLAARAMSNCLILYSDNSSADGIIDKLKQIGGWCGYSTMKSELLTKELCTELRLNGWEIQSSIPKVEERGFVIQNGITMLLSDDYD